MKKQMRKKGRTLMNRSPSDEQVVFYSFWSVSYPRVACGIGPLSGHQPNVLVHQLRVHIQLEAGNLGELALIARLFWTKGRQTMTMALMVTNRLAVHLRCLCIVQLMAREPTLHATWHISSGYFATPSESRAQCCTT